MDPEFERALVHFIAACPYVTALRDLITKQRIELQNDYVLDCYYNLTLGKYSYTLVQGEKRLIGWDNAPHHTTLPNFPHHVHRPDGAVEASELNGEPWHDLEIVLAEVNTLLATVSENS
jgi:hypothetical protein